MANIPILQSFTLALHFSPFSIGKGKVGFFCLTSGEHLKSRVVVSFFEDWLSLVLKGGGRWSYQFQEASA
jgi:hypothetical protein